MSSIDNDSERRGASVDLLPERSEKATSDFPSHRLTFTGSGKTYFWICLRTFLLATLTLGIYDAWGVVERRKYRLGHIRLDVHGFGYHARPITILVGRLIAVTAVVAIQYADVLTAAAPPVVFELALLVIVFAIPWLVLRSLRFQLRNTSYRNVRFDFQGSYWRAFLTYILLPIITLLTAGIGYPWVAQKKERFKVDNACLGRSAFASNPRLAPLYKVCLAIVTLVIMGFFGLGIYVVGVAPVGLFPYDLVLHPGSLPVSVMLIYPVAGALLLICLALFQVVFINCLIDGVRLDGGHTIGSDIPVGRYVWVSLTNCIVNLLSFGVAYPWSVVRRLRTVVCGITVHVNGALDDLAAHQNAAGAAVGMEMGALDGVAEGVFTGAV